jgi:hypothetical protein
VLLKELVSWLKRGQFVRFLREICPRKKRTQKYNAASGIIAGELLIRRHVSVKELVSWLKRGQKVPFLREICSPKKWTPFFCPVNGAIAGKLLTAFQL